MVWSTLAEQVTIFTTVFLGIFMEAVPFLLLGSVASGLVEVFVSKEDLMRLMPRNAALATLTGAALGLAFPVCECGVVPLTRRLFRKGLPVSSGIAFLLAAPIINPVVIASTFAAYGLSRIFVMRFVLGLVVATVVGLVFTLNSRPIDMIRLSSMAPVSGGAGEASPVPRTGLRNLSLSEKLKQAMRIGADDFFEMGLYLVIGSVLASLMQTVIPQNVMLSIGSGSLISVLVMQALAYVLSICSTVDAFVSLAFAKTFTTGSVLAFLVFGPMVDIKSTLMFLGVFKRKYVFYLVMLPFLVVTLISTFINLNVAW